MALFKMNRGKAADLPTTLTEGWCYITKDENKFYFDFLDDDGSVKRKTLNAEKSDIAGKLETAVKVGNADFDGSTAITLAQMGALSASSRGIANGVAGLDSNGKIPTSQLPSIYTSRSITLTAGGWSNKTQTVIVTGVTASNTVVVSPAPTSYENYNAYGILCTAQGANSLTFKCDIAPTTSVVVNVLIVG